MDTIIFTQTLNKIAHYLYAKLPAYNHFRMISISKENQKNQAFQVNTTLQKEQILQKIQEARSIVILLEASLEMLQDDRIETDALKVVREKLSEVTQLLR